MREINSSDKNFNDKKYIKSLIMQYHKMMKDDYESQTKTYKNGNVVKNHWRDNMVGFSEVVISFGTERDKEPKEGLNSTEVNFINAKVSLDRVQRFANLYCAKYNVKCLLIAEHNDEKTRHYQLIFTNYLFEEHKNIRFDGKGKTSAFGRGLQEMGAEAFDGIANRGLKGSKLRHKNLKQMHQTEREYKSEKELKNSIRKLIDKEIIDHSEIVNKFFGDKIDYFKLKVDSKKALLDALTNLVLEQVREKIKIVTNAELKQNIEVLKEQLLDKGEVLVRNRVLGQLNEDLMQENEKLKETNATLNNQYEAIRDKTLQIIDLSSKLNQKENENKNLQDELNIFKADKDQIDVLKQKANQSDILQSKLSKANKKIESVEMTNQILLQRKSELEMSLSNEEILREDNNTKQNLIDELQVSIKGKDQKISELENKITQKDSKIDTLENKVTILESFKTKAINFISKISRLMPNFSSLLDNEPPEIKNEIKSRMYSGNEIDM
jgi:putative leucine-rich repeat-containing protein DDB_G0290503